MPDELPAVTVPVGRTTGLSLPSASRVVARGCSSRSTRTDAPLALRRLDGANLLGEPPVRLCTCRLLLAAQREQVLVHPGNLEFLGNILGCFRHGIGAVGLPHLRIGEPPADGGVIDLGVA